MEARVEHRQQGNILDIRDVSVGFDGFTVLDGLQFSMRKGELRFLIGPNGAGKTTLLDVVTGKTKPAKGRVVYDGGVDLVGRREAEIVRLGVGRKFQTPAVFGSLTVLQNLETAAGFRGGLRGLVRPLGEEREARVRQTLGEVGLAAKADALAKALSHGERQWLELGMLLAQDLQLLLLDEPVAGMTRAERDRAGELLQRTARDRSILVVEHDMAFVRQFGSVVTVLHMGKLLAEGPVETVQADPRVIEVYLGRGHAKGHGRPVAQGAVALGA
ncbi:MAG: urea ABC transporter ATP-binding protein UrtD [Chloroflexota bacterium]|nr:urea ABC transporter ATP-binding protein UrtD [Chloroflexota bacterium]